MKKSWDNPIEHSMPLTARVPAETVIGGVRVAPATVLAPMAGVTDTVFRRFIRNASVFSSSQGEGARQSDAAASSAIEKPISNRQSGCGLIMTEFTSADGLTRTRESKRRRYLTYYDDEHPIAAQLFGSDPATLSEAARIVADAGFDLVDLNLCCPARRVVNSNGGSGLLRDLPRIARIFEAVRSAVSIPFTVKFRLGWNDTAIVSVELARLAEQSGLNAVAVHARTREQGYTGQARWEFITQVKRSVGIPVIGNGDVRTPEDACALIEETGCDGVMIGRAAPANPWIFRQIAEYLDHGSYESPTPDDRYRMIHTYFRMLAEEPDLDSVSNSGTIGKMKQFASWFTHGVPGGSALRRDIYESRTGADALDAVDRFFQSSAAVPPEAEHSCEPGDRETCTVSANPDLKIETWGTRL